MTHIENGNDSLEIARSENGDSTSSELERLGEASPCPSGTDTPTERGLAKSRKLEELILKRIQEANALGANTLDLSHKGMRQFPSEILEMTQLENLYLEGNELTSLPDELFDKLPNLKWLDLRRNYLIRLPSVYTGRHQNLRNLLLEGNNLRTLPLELGLIRTLNGLNISNNPLEFPPVSIIEKGTADIQKFLREMIQAKSSGRYLNGTSAGARARTGLRRISAHSARLAAQQFPLETVPAEIDEIIQEDDDDESSSSDDWNDDGDLREYAYRQAQQRSMSTEAARKAASEQLIPINKSAELHRPQSYLALKESKREKLKKAGAMGTVDKNKWNRKAAVSKSLDLPSKQNRKPQSATSVLGWKVNHFPEPPSQDYIDYKMKEERQVARQKELKEKTDAILQRRRDEEMLKEWRDETKRLKQKKYFESLKKGTKDFLDPVTKAPFDVDSDYMKMPTNEDRIKQDVRSAHERLRRKLSPASRQRMEEEKAQRILQLEKRIKQHTAHMHDRRKMPKGTPQEEMEAARKELEVAEALHRELMAKRKEIEYRFKAFVTDVPTSISYTTRKPVKLLR